MVCHPQQDLSRPCQKKSSWGNYFMVKVSSGFANLALIFFMLLLERQILDTA